MPDDLSRNFKVLNDLPMVDGAFCLDAEGRPLYSSLQAPFGMQVFDELGNAVLTFFDGVGESYTPTDECVLDFGPYKLYLRRGAHDRTIGALCSQAPNITSLRVACNLIFRSLPETLSPLSGEAPSPTKAAKPAETPEPKGLFGGGKPKKSSGGGIWD